jgi:DNA-binding response OmpR family regulator
MPEMDGIELCHRVRGDPFTARLPILFLTAKGRPADVVAGLEAGGDDYLVKPFEVRELPARINALLRRAPGGALDPDSEHIVIGSLTLHRTRPEIEMDGHPIELTTVEHRLLHYLMLQQGKPIHTQQLLEVIWDYPPGVGDPQVVHVTIARLRAKIEPQPESPQIIRNMRGRGYLVSE